jgi:hypothetical protein
MDFGRNEEVDALMVKYIGLTTQLHDLDLYQMPAGNRFSICHCLVAVCCLHLLTQAPAFSLKILTHVSGVSSRSVETLSIRSANLAELDLTGFPVLKKLSLGYDSRFAG